MASNYTEHYGLCQWEATDQVLREEFNQDNAKIDAALAENTAAITALTVQLATKGNCSIETFTYMGNGTYGAENPTIINFSGIPTLYVVLASQTLAVGNPDTDYTPAVLYSAFGSSTYITGLETTWNENQLQIVSTAGAYNQLNSSDKKYLVIALYAEDSEA